MKKQQPKGIKKIINKLSLDDLYKDIEEEVNITPAKNHAEYIIESITKTDEEVVNELIESIYVAPDSVIKEKDAIFKIKAENGYSIASTLGNILTIMGKPKSRKTIFLSLIIGNIIKQNNNNDTFNLSVPENRKKILVFDTEQSKGYAQLTYSRVKSIVNGADISNLYVFSLREYDSRERLEIIEKIINHYNDAFLVAIDGIRDLIPDINNATDATMLTSKLLKWSAKNNIHIINVIHQNKADNNARGHLGSELTNKSESVISIDRKDDKISVVKPVNMRDIDFKQFAFGVDDYGTPYLIDNWDNKVSTKEKNILDPENIDLEEHHNILNEIFKNGEVNSYSLLTEQIKNEWSKLGTKMGNAKVVSFIKYYMSNKMIIKLGLGRPSKYILG